MNLRKYRLIMTAGIGLIILTGCCGVAHAQYTDWRGWKPVSTTEVVQAPAPANAAERAVVFANRNSPENIAREAEIFFGLFRDPNSWCGDEKLRALIYGKKWAEALEAYRDFFVERLKFPPPSWSLGPMGNWGFPLRPLDPASRVIYNYIHTADELMANTVRLTVQDPQGSNVTLRLNVGQPGQVNWTWLPPGYSWNSYAFPSNVSQIAYIYGQANCFNALLDEYVKTGEKRYLDKWSEFIDDRFMNWRMDSAAAGFVPICWNDVESYTRGFFPNMMYLVRKVPNFGKDLAPTTLARELLRVWIDYTPRNIRAWRPSTHNRRTGIYGQHLLYLALLCPEFKPAEYCLQQFRWLVETFPTVEMMPDGSDMEPWFCYNCSTPRSWFPSDFGAMRQMSPQPSWLTPQWHAEFFEMCDRRADYLMHRMLNSGRFPYPGGLAQESFYFFNHELADSTGKINPQNVRIRNTLFGERPCEPPSFDSEAFPYLGTYYLRSGWGTNDLCLFMPCTRPGMNMAWPYNNGITLYAYGQELLWIGWDTPIMVDGCPQIHIETYKCYPPERRAKFSETLYGKSSSSMAYRTPLKNRWLDSEQFAMCEGTYPGPFASYKLNPARPTEDWRGLPDKFLEGVAHQRQVVLLKQAGLYVVTDRVRSQKPHEYTLCWSLIEPKKWTYPKVEKPGFTTNQVVLDQAAQTIKTCNPDAANLSLYHVSAIPMQLGEYHHAYIGSSPRKYGGQFSASGDYILTTVMYPRRTMPDDLTDVRSPADLQATDKNSFEATLPDGSQVLYRGALNGSTLKAGNVEINGESLLLLTPKEGKKRGIALGCNSFKINGRQQKLDTTDFEFELDGKNLGAITPIYRPMDMVEFSPKPDCFTDQVEVAMSCPEPDVDIRYTLDGSDPDGSAHLYEKPVVLWATTTVKARAFRKGVTRVPPTVSGDKVSAVQTVVYTRETVRKPDKASTVAQPGLNYSYYEENPWQLSAYLVDVVKPVKTGLAKELFDISAKGTNGVYAFVYHGLIDIPADGVYSFHAPEEFINAGVDSGYDLRVFLGREEEWYPATRWHNYGTWSVPLTKGLYFFRVVWVDQRKQDVHGFDSDDRLWDGEKPVLMISGPGLEKQPIPAAMLRPY